MTKSSCIQHPAKQSIVIVKEAYKQLCEDAPDSNCAAAMLNLFEYWTNIKAAMNEQADAHNKVRTLGGLDPTQDTGVWVWKTTEHLQLDLMGMWGKSKIEAARKWLVTVCFLLQRNNPDYAWDRTYQFTLNITTVQELLDDPSLRTEYMQGLDLRDQRLKSKPAIPETTTETTEKTLAAENAADENPTTTITKTSKTCVDCGTQLVGRTFALPNGTDNTRFCKTCGLNLDSVDVTDCSTPLEALTECLGVGCLGIVAKACGKCELYDAAMFTPENDPREETVANSQQFEAAGEFECPSCEKRTPYRRYSNGAMYCNICNAFNWMISPSDLAPVDQGELKSSGPEQSLPYCIGLGRQCEHKIDGTPGKAFTPWLCNRDPDFCLHPLIDEHGELNEPGQSLPVEGDKRKQHCNVCQSDTPHVYRRLYTDWQCKKCKTVAMTDDQKHIIRTANGERINVMTAPRLEATERMQFNVLTTKQREVIAALHTGAVQTLPKVNNGLNNAGCLKAMDVDKHGSQVWILSERGRRFAGQPQMMKPLARAKSDLDEQRKAAKKKRDTREVKCPEDVAPYAALVSGVFYADKLWVDLSATQRKFIIKHVNIIRKQYSVEDCEHAWRVWLPGQKWETTSLAAFTNGKDWIGVALKARNAKSSDLDAIQIKPTN